MPFSFLLWKCLRPGKTSFQEPGAGWGVQVQSNSDETILFLATDSADFRDYYKEQGCKLQNVSDLLVFCARKGRRPILLFVELKGSDIAHAAEQLRRTVEAVRNSLPSPMRKEADYRALILATGSAPKNQGTIQKEFLKRHRIELQVKTGVRKGTSVPLRPYLGD